jgi:hypothetical protein
MINKEIIRETIIIGKEMEENCFNEKNKLGKIVYNAPAICSSKNNYKNVLELYRELAELYLADKLCEPMPVDEIAKIVHNTVDRFQHHHHGYDDKIVKALVGKITKQISADGIPDIKIGKYLISRHDDNSFRISKADGEGGQFYEEELEKIIERYYNLEI